MAQGFYGSICLTDIFGAFIQRGQDGSQWVNLSALQAHPFNIGQSNGKVYLNISVWQNDQPDNYGQIANISLSQTKEQAAAKEKRVFIGNLKANGQPAQQQAAPMPQGGYPPAPPPFPQQAGYAQAPAQAPFQQQPAMPQQAPWQPAPQPPGPMPGGYQGNNQLPF